MDISSSETIKSLVPEKTKEGVGKCNYCDVVCANARSLWQHLKTHYGEKPYICKQCDFAFVQAGHLRIHLRTHSGTKPFKCNQCDFADVWRSDLGKHLKTHSGTKPHKCKQCDFASANEFNVTKTNFGLVYLDFRRFTSLSFVHFFLGPKVGLC